MHRDTLAPPTPGTFILGYELLEELAHGGHTSVYRARRGEQTVILKLLSLEHPSPAQLERFRREYELTRRVPTSTGGPRVLSLEPLGASLCLVLSDLGPLSLSQVLAHQRLDFLSALRLAVGLAAQLDAVHQHGIIHKDLNPSNVLFDPESGAVEIVDFGISTDLARESTRARGASLIEGTLPYLAPEQTGRMNRLVDSRTDLYSLGATLYKAFTGRRPFDSTDPATLIHCHLAQRPQPAHEREPRVPQPLSAILERLLAKPPESRYQSARGLLADLQHCLNEWQTHGRIEPFPLGRGDASARFESPQKLYGRDAEVAALRESFERVRSGAVELVLITGSSGIGKSSIVHALLEPVVAARGSFASGKFDQYKRDIPYATLVQALRERVLELAAGSDSALAEARTRLHSALSPNGRVLLELVPEAELVLGPQPPVPELPFTEAQHRFQRVLGRFVGALAQHGHPLVLFLDDLQWVDAATLRLLQHLATSAELGHLLLVGAYRDNEVGPSHPLSLMLEELRKAGTPLRWINPGPLAVEHVRQLVSEALCATEQAVQELAELVHAKTGGNPLFLTQLLSALHAQGLIRFDTQAQSFRWDLAELRTRAFSDNVVDLMIARLGRFDRHTQDALRLAACAGNRMELRTLATILGVSEEETVHRLREAVAEGLVLASGRALQFLHDRVQQAAYSLTPEAERGALHLRIGRVLLEHTPPEALEEWLFEIVNQLNLGAEGIASEAERVRLAELDLRAGRKAQASAAWQSAARLFATGSCLLGEPAWESRYELAWQLASARAECEYMSGQYEAAERQLALLLERARGPLDKAAVYRVCVDLFTSRVQLERAVESGVEGLALLGLQLSTHPSEQEVQAAYQAVWEALGSRRIEDLVELPPMAEPHVRAAMDIFGGLFGAVIGTDRNLLILCYCHMVRLSILHGNCEASALAYVYFGMVIGPGFERYREGYAFGRLGYELAERNRYLVHKAKVEMVFGDCVLFFTRHVRHCVEHLHRAFSAALESGDVVFACYCCNHLVVDLVVLGHPLAEVYEESVRRLDFTTGARFEAPSWCIRAMQRFIANMRGLTASFSTYEGEGFHQAEVEALLDGYEWPFPVGLYYIYKMVARLFSGDLAEALEAGEKAERLLWAGFAHMQVQEWWFYFALVLAQSLEGAPEPVRQERLRRLATHEERLRTWAGTCPDNYEHKHALVLAELARLEGRPLEALGHYERSVASARAQGYVQNEGLAHELASRLCAAQGLRTAAEAHLRHARQCYLRWGALGKVRDMEQRHPELRLGVPERPPLPAASALHEDSTTTGSDFIDSSAALKAAVAISGELVLDRLLARLIEILVEHAGARRGLLLLSREQGLTLEARGDSERRAYTREPSLPLEGAGDELPRALVQSVARTRRSLVLEEATRDSRFRQDPYVQRARPLAVLCAPVLHQGKLTGVIYLENDLTPGAFTADRVDMVVMLAAQGAVSVENALLYERLEQRVEERTRELRQAQRELVDTARRAGMAEIATNTLHNVGNVLSSVNVALGLAGERVRALSPARLGAVAELLRQHEGRLPELFAEERGRLVPEYLERLTAELRSHWQEALQELELLRSHIEHIHGIVRMQQSFAGSSQLLERVSPAELIESALQLGLPSLERHQIEVRRELPPLEPVLTDRHKVQQILVNLISNAKHALTAMPMGQRVLTVRLSQPAAERWRVEVVDTGVGIAAENLSRIFQHGFTTRKDGHGFGLHASALTAAEMGGELLARSEGPGKGATFALTLPVRLQEPSER